MLSFMESRPLAVDVSLFVVTCFLALTFQALSTKLGITASMAFNLVVIVMFIWSLRRPYFISPPVLLLIGLIQDLLTGTPLGVWAIAYIVAFTVARDRDADGAGADLGPLVLRFAILVAIAFFIAWAVGSAAIGAPARFQSLIAQAFLTIIFFPVLAWLFVRRKDRATYF